MLVIRGAYIRGGLIFGILRYEQEWAKLGKAGQVWRGQTDRT